MLQSHFFEYLGRLHPLTVHFPIAFLLGAALVEIFALIRRRQPGGAAAFAMLILAFFGSLVAAPLGWLNAGTSKHPGAEQLVEYHRWAGIATLGLSLLALGLLIWMRSRWESGTRDSAGHGWMKVVYLAVLLLAVGTAVVTAHWGGEITYGEGYFSYSGADKDMD